MRATVPSNIVDNSYEVFPEGNYEGALAGAEHRDVKGDGSWKTLKIVTDNITPREGTGEPGRSKFQADITLTTDGVDIFEVEDFSSKDVPFGIVRSAGLLAGLAEGLNLGTRGPNGVEVDLKAVVEALIDGQFAGEKVSFQVSHYKPKNSDKVYEQYNRFGAA